MEEAILYHLKLKLAHCADYLAAVELMDKELGNTFVHQLLYAFLKLLCFHGVGVLDIHEHLRREARQALVVNFLSFSKGVADLEVTCIGNTDDIAGNASSTMLFF